MAFLPWPSNKPKLLDTAKFSVIEYLSITPHEIGRGAYGTVYAAVYDGKSCVAKEMHPFFNNQNSSASLEVFYKEINTLASLKHPSIVQFLGVYFRDKSSPPILIMERMWKNLFVLLEERPNQLPLFIKTHILYDVACGLQYLHGQKKPVVHRDLTANNILLTENLVAKIADLGQAKALEKLAGQRLSTAPGNVAYSAPETLKHKPIYDSKLDIFSFGCTVIHVVTEQFPTPTDRMVESKNDPNLYVKVPEADRRKGFLDLMEDVSIFLQQITYQCLQDAPSSRPISSYICDELEKYMKELEKESENEVTRCKQDKLSLLWSLQTTEAKLERKEKTIEELNLERNRKEEYLTKKDENITALEQKLQDTQSALDQIKFSSKQEKETLKKELTIQDEINKRLTATYTVQVDRLREDVKVKQEEIKAADEKFAELQEDANSLEIKVKEETLEKVQVRHKVTELSNQLQQVTKMADNLKQELAIAKDNYAKQEDRYKTEYNQLELESGKKLKNVTGQCAKNEGIIAQLNKKLEEREHELKKAVELKENYREKYTELYQKHEESKLESKKRLKKEVFQPVQVTKKVTDPGTKLHQQLLELQQINEMKHHQLHQQRLEYTNTFKHQDKKVAAVQGEMMDLKKKYGMQKQQLEEKSYRLSTLESSFNEMQELLYFREEKLKCSEEECATLNKLLETNNKLQRVLQSDLKSKEESLKRKDDELNLLKKEHADELNQLRVQYSRQIDDLTKDVEMYKSQHIGKEDISKLLVEEAHYKSDMVKSTEEKMKKLENELKNTAKTQKMLKRQIKNQEVNLKEKTKHIEQLENNNFDGGLLQYCYNVNWYPYVSLPVKSIRSSAAIIKDKMFITGGYQQINPQGEELDSYLKSLERGYEVFCFHTTKCRCDSIASPVVLGGVANVNGQCVLVGGAEGNTLTGNVYVLCEEGSDEQWKKFSEPVPTPRILPCVCCYSERWMIVCGGYAFKGGSSLLEAVNVVEIFDTTKEEWITLSNDQCPSAFNILCCAVANEDVYIIGDGKIFKCNSNKLITASTKKPESTVPLWSEVETLVEGLEGDLFPFSVVEVNRQPMIIASISGSEDDVTCVLMKDTTDTWRKMCEAVECQHCSAVVVTPTLELLLFGGSKSVSVDIATDMAQKASLIPSLNLHDKPSKEMKAVSTLRKDAFPLQEIISEHLSVAINQPPAVSFTGPTLTKQFDHKGGTFQSPVHKVSIVVPPNAIDNGEKVTVHMGATTSGPFDLPKDCKLRSAVVWLGSESDVVLKRNIAVVVPHSAVFTSPQHHSMMRFLTCEDCKGPRYKFRYSPNHFDIDEEQGCIELNKPVMVAIAASPEYALDEEGIQCNSEEEMCGSDDEYYEAPEGVESLGTPQTVTNHKLHHKKTSPKGKTIKMPPARYLAKLFWPRGQLPNCFRVDVYYLQNLPTEVFKINTMYRKAYYEENGTYPEILETELMIDGDGTELKCVLPCSGSSECDCLSGWSVIQTSNMVEISVEKDTPKYKIDPMKFSFKFGCSQPTTNLRCCFEFKGADRIMNGTMTQIPRCLEKRYQLPNLNPFIMQQAYYNDADVEKLDVHKMNVQVEEGPVTDSHQVKNLL
ncbi:uncharacterized protein [Dysidea avara]|uniref:uncharacterized protein isoform X2 n=1 Tax=Dysidea avara TaxID=196820 RepID=UPI00333042CE